MAEYIEKQAVIDEVDEWYNLYQDIDTAREALSLLRKAIKKISPEDVRNMRRGRWEMDSDNVPHCTECDCVAPQRMFLQLKSLACTTQFIMSNYCPNCGSYNGADMRGGDADG